MDKQDVEDVAELAVRRYFDIFLKETLPTILTQHVEACPYGKKVAKWKYMIAGVLAFFTLTGSAYGLVRVIQAIS